MSAASSAAQSVQPLLSLTVPSDGGTMTPVTFWAQEAISTPFLVTIQATLS